MIVVYYSLINVLSIFVDIKCFDQYHIHFEKKIDITYLFHNYMYF